MDGGEDFSSLPSGISATLTEAQGAITPLSVTFDTDGTFALKNGTNTVYLPNGDYTLTVQNATAAPTPYGFTTTTSSTPSSMPSSGVYDWYMDIAQADIAQDHTQAVYSFTIDASSDALLLAGVGLKASSLVSYVAGTGTSFTTASEYKNHNQHPSSTTLPIVDQTTNRQTGYDPASLAWTADKAVALSDATIVAAGDPLTRTQVLAIRVTEPLVLTASLQLKSYTVAFDYNGGSGTPALPQGSKNLGDSINLPSAPARTGYTFSGWALSASATSALASLGPAAVFYTLDAAGINALFATDTTDTTTLYAVWAPRTDIPLALDANGGTNGNVTSLTNLTFDQTLTAQGKTLPTTTPDAPTRTGYTFAGWATTSSASVADFTDASVVNWTAPKTVYAVWTPLSNIQLAFDENGGIPGSTASWTDLIFDSTLTAQSKQLPTTGSGAPTRTGYTFQGWSTTSGTSNSVDFTNTSVVNWTSPKTVYAVWTLERFTIGFEAATGGSLLGTTSYPSIGYGTAWAASGITVPTPTADAHWLFLRWEPALPDTSDAITQDAVYKAVFTLDSHTLTYHAQSATSGSVPAAQTYVHGTQVGVASQGSLVRTGYTFTGWSTDSTAASVTHGSGSSLVLVADTHLYAVWTQDPTHVLTYAPGAPAPEVGGIPAPVFGIAQNTTVTAAQAPTREGHRFTGWASSAGSTLQPGQTFAMPAANVTLTATWEETAAFGVTYDANQGTGAVPTDDTRYRTGDTVTVLTSPVPVREGYRFAGWARTQSGGVVSSFAITADTTLYAQWQEERPTVVTPVKPEDDGSASGGPGSSAIMGAVTNLSSDELAQLEQQTGDILSDIAAGTVPLGNPLVTGA
jgi:uncharacterized repeat protein (TIGR02543 family)